MHIIGVFFSLACAPAVAATSAIGYEEGLDNCWDHDDEGDCSAKTSLMQVRNQVRMDADQDPEADDPAFMQMTTAKKAVDAVPKQERGAGEPQALLQTSIRNVTSPTAGPGRFAVLLQKVKNASPHLARSTMLLAQLGQRAASKMGFYTPGSTMGAETVAVILIFLVMILTLLGCCLMGSMAYQEHRKGGARRESWEGAPAKFPHPSAAALNPAKYAKTNNPVAQPYRPSFPGTAQASSRSVAQEPLAGNTLMAQRPSLVPPSRKSSLSLAPSQLTQRSCMPQHAVPPLCAELVAPDGNETVLSIPCLSSVAFGGSELEFQIFNADMEPMLGLRVERVNISTPRGGARGARGERLELFEWANRRGLAAVQISNGRGRLVTANGEVRACVCREGGVTPMTGYSAPPSQGRIPVFAIGSIEGNMDPSMYVPAAVRVAAGPHAYVVCAEPSGETLLRIQGHDTGHERGLIAASNECAVAALTEPGKQSQDGFEYCWLKAGPGVDAGLCLLSMLSIDRLLQQQR